MNYADKRIARAAALKTPSTERGEVTGKVSVAFPFVR